MKLCSYVCNVKTSPILHHKKLAKASRVLKAVAHPTRLQIICLLAQSKNLSLTSLTEKTDSEQSLISHHLTNMKRDGILEINRTGKNILYSLADKNILKLIKCLNNCKSI